MRRHSRDQAKMLVNNLTSELKEKYPNLANSVGDVYIKKLFSQLYRTSVFHKKEQRRTSSFINTSELLGRGYNEIRL
jgi:hypothetical protein